MESLALLVSLMLLGIYSTGLIAFGFSWIRNKVAKVLTLIFGSISVATGVWLVVNLFEGNGLLVGGIPVLLGVFSIWNTLRRNRA